MKRSVGFHDLFLESFTFPPQAAILISTLDTLVNRANYAPVADARVKLRAPVIGSLF